MIYSPKITYPIYDLNSSLFLEIIRNILETEFQNQINIFGNLFLPISVSSDSYLLDPISDKEINPAFCSIIKAKSINLENQFHSQENIKNTFIIGILADGIENLRKICDAIYIILNDMEIKSYIFLITNEAGEKLISDDSSFKVSSMSTEFEVSKTMNDKNIVYGSIQLEAEIEESFKFNIHVPLKEVHITHQLGENLTELKQTEILTT